MKPSTVTSDSGRPARGGLNPGLDTRQLGLSLRTIYESGIDTQPITDDQVALVLRLRQKERDLRRSA